MGAAVLLATLGVYFLLGRPWAEAVGYEFAGAARPILGLALLAAAVVVLAIDARKRRERAARTIVLFTRESCTPCAEASAALAAVAARHGFVVWEEDVDSDPALAARWGEVVPVAVLGDVTLFTTRLDVAVVEKTLSRLS